MYISEFYCICVFNNVYPRIYTVKYVFVSNYYQTSPISDMLYEKFILVTIVLLLTLFVYIRTH